MSQKSSRPSHDRSRRIKDFENNNLIQLIEKEDGVVSQFGFFSNFFQSKI